MFVLLYSIVKLRIKDIRLTRTSLYYRQFALSLPKERSHIFFKCKPLNMNIRLIQTLFMPPPPPSPQCPYKRGFTIRLNPALRTPASYGHPVNTDTFFLMPPPPLLQCPYKRGLTIQSNLSLQTPRSYGHFLLMAPSVSLLTGFDCRRDYMKFCTFGTTRYLWNTVKSRLLVNADTEVVIETVRND